jgi:hypothetical protein
MANRTVPPPSQLPQITIACTYCGEPAAPRKRIVADGKPYCKKLCAALGLIRDTNDEDGIDCDTGVDALMELVEDAFLDGPLRIPCKVRERDLELAIRSLSDRVVIVPIDDEGTPDWLPEPTSSHKSVRANEGAEDPSQSQIDSIVENLLRDEEGGRL